MTIELVSDRPVATRRWRRARDVVDDIEARAKDPHWSLTLAGDELVTVSAGEIVVLVAAAKRGKTSLAVCLLLEHAHERGPAIAVSLELRERLLVARAIGTRCDTSWRGVLRGDVTRERQLQVLPERLIVIDRDVATIATIEATIEDIKREYPGQPVLVAVDYLQLLPSEERDMRARVDDAMKQIDRVAQAKAVAVLALSQSSRAASRELATGERIGAAAADTGAESAAIERWASAVLAIGKVGTEADDGSSPAEISIAAQRYEGGDRVIGARYTGKSGHWRLTGEARSATEVREQRDTERTQARQTQLRHAIADLLTASPTPIYRADLCSQLGAKRADVLMAVKALLDEGRVVAVGRKRGGHQPVWVPERVRANAPEGGDHE